MPGALAAIVGAEMRKFAFPRLTVPGQPGEESPDNVGKPHHLTGGSEEVLKRSCHRKLPPEFRSGKGENAW